MSSSAAIPQRPRQLPQLVLAEAPAPDRPRNRREQILDVSSRVFAERGYHGASLREIARHVGISHPGMLHHFASKEILLGCVIDRLEDSAQESLDQLQDLCSRPDELAERLAVLYDPGSPPIQLLAVLDSECVSTEHPGRFRIARLRRVHEHLLEQCFEQLRCTGRLRPDTDSRRAARLILSVVMGHAVRGETLRLMQTPRSDDEPREDLCQLVHLFLAT